MRSVIFVILLFFSITAYAQSSVDDVIEQIGLKTGVSKTQNSVPRWRPSDELVGMYDQYDSLVNGVRFKAIPRDKAYEIVDEYYDLLKSQGHTLYLTNLDFDNSFRTIYDIAVLPISDQLEAVRLVGTEAPNYDLSNEQVVDWLKQRTSAFQFELFVIDYDRLEARFVTEPESYRELAKKIYEFCPDVIDQGHDNMKSLIKHLRTEKRMWFWWD